MYTYIHARGAEQEGARGDEKPKHKSLLYMTNYSICNLM